MKAEQRALIGVAKATMKEDSKGAPMQDLINANKVRTQRCITAPSLLELYCNTMELMRLRQEIIMVASECAVL